MSDEKTSERQHVYMYELAKDFGLPLVVLLVGSLVTYTQIQIEEGRIERQESLEEKRIWRQEDIEKIRITRQENIEENRNQIAILNNYRRSISGLIGKEKFADVAGALTKSTLPQLDGKRKGNLVAFMIGLGTIGGLPRVSLSYTDLTGANLSGADLSGANFLAADLSRANLSGADLRPAKNMTREQIASACADPENPAILPKGWKQPPPCPDDDE